MFFKNKCFFSDKTFGDSAPKNVHVGDSAEAAADRESHDHEGSQSSPGIPAASWDTDKSLPVMSLMAEHLVFSSNSALVTLGKEPSGI